MANEQKDNVNDESNIIEQLRKLEKRNKNKSICPYCSQQVEFIWVHGHYQCPNCRNVVTSCCGDT